MCSSGIFNFTQTNIIAASDFFSFPSFLVPKLSRFLVPKPRLGNALAGEAPASRDGRRTEAGLRAQVRSQAGAWERGKV
jgi:hypothetical protein